MIASRRLHDDEAIGTLNGRPLAMLNRHRGQMRHYSQAIKPPPVSRLFRRVFALNDAKSTSAAQPISGNASRREYHARRTLSKMTPSTHRRPIATPPLLLTRASTAFDGRRDFAASIWHRWRHASWRRRELRRDGVIRVFS